MHVLSPSQWTWQGAEPAGSAFGAASPAFGSEQLRVPPALPAVKTRFCLSTKDPLRWWGIFSECGLWTLFVFPAKGLSLKLTLRWESIGFRFLSYLGGSKNIYPRLCRCLLMMRLNILRFSSVDEGLLRRLVCFSPLLCTFCCTLVLAFSAGKCRQFGRCFGILKDARAEIKHVVFRGNARCCIHSIASNYSHSNLSFAMSRYGTAY